MRLVYRYLGYLLIISAFFRLIPIATALYYEESFLPFVWSMLFSLLVGLAIAFYFREQPKERIFFTTYNGLILAAISFVFLPLIGSVSFLPTLDFNFLNAYFESISGFTTTGLSMYNDLDSLPKSLLMWRATTQWLGGIGIITIFMFIFSRLKHHDYLKLSEVQDEVQKRVKLAQSSGIIGQPQGSLRGSLRNLLLIYVGYTLLGIVLLALVGLPFYEAVGMTFTALSTGGFSLSSHFYQQGSVLIILSVLMILGATSFVAHNKLLRKQFKEFLFSFEKNLMLFLIVIFSLLAFLSFSNLKEILFVTISAFTTTGFSTADVNLLPQLFVFLIFIAMIVGGTFASTSGGIKVFRVYYLLKTIPWSIRKLIAPKNAVIPLEIDDELVDEAKLVNIGIFVFTYIFFLVLGTIVFMVFGYSFFDSAFHITSALGTVGLQGMDLVMIPATLKIILILAMLMGRLELFPLLILIRQVFTKHK